MRCLRPLCPEAVIPEAYSREFRRDVLRDCDAGLGTQAIALKYRVSESWGRRCKQQRRESGQVEAKRTCARTPKWHAWGGWLRETLAAEPDLYLRELKARLLRERGIDVCEDWIGKVCRLLKVTRKKDTPRRRAGPRGREGA